jgi:hypothetical protein
LGKHISNIASSLAKRNAEQQSQQKMVFNKKVSTTVRPPTLASRIGGIDDILPSKSMHHPVLNASVSAPRHITHTNSIKSFTNNDWMERVKLIPAPMTADRGNEFFAQGIEGPPSLEISNTTSKELLPRSINVQGGAFSSGGGVHDMSESIKKQGTIRTHDNYVRKNLKSRGTSLMTSGNKTAKALRKRKGELLHRRSNIDYDETASNEGQKNDEENNDALSDSSETNNRAKTLYVSSSIDPLQLSLDQLLSMKNVHKAYSSDSNPTETMSSSSKNVPLVTHSSIFMPGRPTIRGTVDPGKLKKAKAFKKSILSSTGVLSDMSSDQFEPPKCSGHHLPGKLRRVKKEGRNKVVRLMRHHNTILVLNIDVNFYFCYCVGQRILCVCLSLRSAMQFLYVGRGSLLSH